jgi:hypothetical protein
MGAIHFLMKTLPRVAAERVGGVGYACAQERKKKAPGVRSSPGALE